MVKSDNPLSHGMTSTTVPIPADLLRVLFAKKTRLPTLNREGTDTPISAKGLKRLQSWGGCYHIREISRRLNERLFQNVMPTIRTFRRCFQNVIRHPRI